MGMMLNKNNKQTCCFISGLFATLFLMVVLLIPFSYSASAQTAADTLNNPSLSGIWSDIKKGARGRVSIQDQKAGTLIQTEGESWRQFRNGDLAKWGCYGLLGIIGLLLLFYLLNGRVRIQAGLAGRTIERFKFLERAMHWLLAVSFIVLALSGLNLLYGKSLLLPLLGGSAFASLTIVGKWLHNFMGFSFMIALVWTLFTWIRHNLPSRSDITWLAQGGGFIGNKHPPAKKFNAGQKIIFWSVILGGFFLSLSGIALLMPFEWHLFAKTNGLLNMVGFSLPTQLTDMQETQLAQQWHAIMALIMIIIIIAHIYIGTIGMEGSFDAMGSGEVDENWAKEHHSLWVDEMGVHSQSDGQKEIAQEESV